MKITPQTTLSELELERIRLGVVAEMKQLKHEPDGAMRVEIMLITDDGITVGIGSSVPDAYADAFGRREQQIAALCDHSPFRSMP